MTILTLASFPNHSGLSGAPRQLVEFSEANRLAFLDAGRAGNPATVVTLIDQGLQAGQEIEHAAVVDCDGSLIAINVTSRGAAEFSLHDGAVWRGPFSLTGDVSYSMLVRSSIANPLVHVKVKAIHASQRVFIQAGPAKTAEQLAAVQP